MLRLLSRPRWLALGGLVVAVVVAFAQLGLWQLDRAESRRARTDLIERNLLAAPAPVDGLARVGARLDDAVQWRAVTAVGRYDPSRTVLVRNRPFESRRGAHVLVPLVTTAGPAVLVNRGWLPVTGAANAPIEVPSPPAGVVAVTGRLRTGEALPDAAALERAEVPQPSVGRVDPLRLAQTLPYPAYGGYAELVQERPAPAAAPTPVPAPALDEQAFGEGANLSYAFQWFLFALTAVVGVVVLLRRELREVREARAAGKRQ